MERKGSVFNASALRRAPRGPLLGVFACSAVAVLAAGCVSPRATTPVRSPAQLERGQVLRVVRFVDDAETPAFGLAVETDEGFDVFAIDGEAGSAGTLAEFLELARTPAELAMTGWAYDLEGLAEEGRVLSPVTRPRNVVCVGNNYAAHAAQTGSRLGERVTLFAKSPESLAGPRDPIPVDADDALVDYEVELGVVIGRPIPRGTRFDSGADLLDCVGGFVLVNDVSVRDDQLLYGQWWLGKSHERSSPVGPFLLLATDAVKAACAERGFPNVELTLAVRREGGEDYEERQRAYTDAMHADLVEVVNVVASAVSLHPGDLIVTGAPGGTALQVSVSRRRMGELFVDDAAKRAEIFVRSERKRLASGKSLYLRPGDTVRARGTWLGEQRNPVETR